MIIRKLTKKEVLWGIVYLCFSLLCLPVILVLANLLLPAPLDDAYVNLIFFGLNFIAVICIFQKHLQCALENLLNNIRGILLCACIGFIAYFLSSFLIGLIIQALLPAFVNLNDAAIETQMQDHFGIMIIGTVILVPTAEEMLHRALVFGTLWHKSPVLAYCVSAILFSAIHVVGYIGLYEPPMLLASFIQYIPAGICLACTYRKSENILAPILVHTAVNAIGMFSMR